MENINYWQVFISNFESRFIFCFVYLLGMAGYDYRALKAGRKKNSPETLRPDKKTQESIQKQKTPITNNIDPKTLMSNYVAPQNQETQPISIAEASSKPDVNKNNQKEISLNLFDDMMKEEEEKEVIEHTEEPQDQDGETTKTKQEKLRIYQLEQDLKAEKERQEALEYGEEVY